MASVDLDLIFHSLSVEQLRHKLEAGEELSLTEIAYLHDSDEIRMDELAEYFRDADEELAIDDGRIQSKMTNF